MKQARKIEDPIVAEVRRARSELFAECGNDLRDLFAHMTRRRKAGAAGAKKATKLASPRRRKSV
jgi:hypothetical protein